MWSESIDLYCERLGAPFWAEPVNALSNIAFLFAAATAFRLWRKDGGGDLGILALIAVVAMVALGSFAFHTIATRGAMLLDVVPIERLGEDRLEVVDRVAGRQPGAVLDFLRQELAAGADVVADRVDDPQLVSLAELGLAQRLHLLDQRDALGVEALGRGLEHPHPLLEATLVEAEPVALADHAIVRAARHAAGGEQGRADRDAKQEP